MDYGQPTTQDSEKGTNPNILNDANTQNEPTTPSPEHNLGEMGSSAIESSVNSSELANSPHEIAKPTTTPELGQVVNLEMPPDAKTQEEPAQPEKPADNPVKIKTTDKGLNHEGIKALEATIEDFESGGISAAELYKKVRGEDGLNAQNLEHSFARKVGEEKKAA